MHHNEVKKRTQTPDMDKQHKGESYDFFFQRGSISFPREKKFRDGEYLFCTHKSFN